MIGVVGCSTSALLKSENPSPTYRQWSLFPGNGTEETVAEASLVTLGLESVKVIRKNNLHFPMRRSSGTFLKSFANIKTPVAPVR